MDDIHKIITTFNTGSVVTTGAVLWPTPAVKTILSHISGVVKDKTFTVMRIESKVCAVGVIDAVMLADVGVGDWQGRVDYVSVRIADSLCKTTSVGMNGSGEKERCGGYGSGGMYCWEQGGHVGDIPAVVRTAGTSFTGEVNLVTG